jgi:hypothetical protein
MKAIIGHYCWQAFRHQSGDDKSGETAPKQAKVRAGAASLQSNHRMVMMPLNLPAAFHAPFGDAGHCARSGGVENRYSSMIG